MDIVEKKKEENGWGCGDYITPPESFQVREAYDRIKVRMCISTEIFSREKIFEMYTRQFYIQTESNSVFAEASKNGQSVTNE